MKWPSPLYNHAPLRFDCDPIANRCINLKRTKNDKNKPQSNRIETPKMNAPLNEKFWQRLKKPIVGLSPMDGVTDPCFRRMMAMHGRPDLIMTEFLSVDGIGHGAESALQGLAYHESERPIVAQLYGPKPETFYHVAQLVCELGFDGLDINMGCPSKKVSALGSGAALIQDPPRAQAIVEAAKQGIARWVSGAPLTICETYPMVADWLAKRQDKYPCPPIDQRRPIPVSVKTRIGVDRIVIGDWIRSLLEVAPAAISIHGRTLKQGYRGEANWERIAEAVAIARGTGTLILGNGDLHSLKDAYRRIRETGVDGVLIGRAAMGNPWIFHKKEVLRSFLRQTETAQDALDFSLLQEKAVNPHARFGVALQHARLFQASYGEAYFKGMRKHLGAYCYGFEGARALRSHMVRVKNAEEAALLISKHLSHPAVPSDPMPLPTHAQLIR